MKLALALLLIIFLYLQWKLWFADGGLREVYQLEKAIAIQQRENRSLEQDNHALSAEVNDLKNGLNAVEERARSELGMIREGETFFQVIE